MHFPVDKIYNAEKFFLDYYTLSKKKSKSDFWLYDPLLGRQEGVFGKFVLYR